MGIKNSLLRNRNLVLKVKLRKKVKIMIKKVSCLKISKKHQRLRKIMV